MKSSFEKELEVQDNYFICWDDAAKHYVQKIFSFSEQCGNKSIIEIVNDIYTHNGTGTTFIPFTFINFTGHSEYIEYLKNLINSYIEQEMNKIDPQRTEDFTSSEEFFDSIRVHQAFFLLASHCAISLFKYLSEHPDYSGFVNTILNPSMIASTVIRKQNDYGPENIAKFGMWGLIVRLHDKIARFENLMSKKRQGVNAVSDETVYDTLLDIVGYSTVALLWINGDFLLPLQKDLVG